MKKIEISIIRLDGVGNILEEINVKVPETTNIYRKIKDFLVSL